MNSKSTWVWLGLAAVLFGVVFSVEKFGPKPPAGPAPLLPGFQAALVTSVQLGLGDQREIQAVRTNGHWQLVKPIAYPAQDNSIDTLLVVLQQLAPMVELPGAEVRQRRNADQEFGFSQPQVTLTLKSRDTVRPVLIGARTANGDQVYVQVVGVEGVFVVDAALLKLFPRTVDDWRDTAFADLTRLLFDHVSVSNAVTSLELQRDGTNQLWRLTRPMAARADNQRVNRALQKLNATRVSRFVTDDPKADPDSFGLATPELELRLAQDTNLVAVYQFGRSPTNDSTQVFARRVGVSTIVTVPKELLAVWRAPLNQFRDPYVVTFAQPVDRLEFRDGASFTLQRTGDHAWRLADSPLPVDAGAVGEVLTTLGNLGIEQFKDSITETDLSLYGLQTPARQVVVSATVTNGTTATNLVLAALSFGVATNGEVFARRADENPVYGIAPSSYLGLPTAAWQLRERRIWNFAASNVVRLVIAERGQRRELRRTEANAWVLAPGSQGSINPQFVEKAVEQFATMSATAWTARGTNGWARYGFTTNAASLTFELKDGTKYRVDFGGMSPANYCYAAVTLAGPAAEAATLPGGGTNLIAGADAGAAGGETWVFELPMALHQFRLFALSLAPPAR